MVNIGCLDCAEQMGSQILSRMSDEEKQLFQEYRELWERMAYISEEDMFVNSFTW